MAFVDGDEWVGHAGEVGMVVCLWYYYTTLMGFNLNLTADILSASSTRVASNYITSGILHSG